MQRLTPLALLLIALPGNAFAKFDIPTGAPPSPLFGAQPFTQQLVLFEELGSSPLPRRNCTTCVDFPQPSGCDNSPASADLDGFLEQPLSPLPTEADDDGLANPWRARIAECLARPFTGVL